MRGAAAHHIRNGRNRLHMIGMLAFLAPRDEAGEERAVIAPFGDGIDRFLPPRGGLLKFQDTVGGIVAACACEKT